MGTWGIGPFENDSANDWACSLEGTTDLSLDDSTLDEVIASAGDYLEVDEAASGLAACEVLACLIGSGSVPDAYSEKAHAWVSGMTVRPDAAILLKARSAIDRVLAPESELQELWEESEDADAWRSGVEGLRNRLSTSRE